MTKNVRVAAATLSIILVYSTGALAADPAVKCESGKLKISSKYSACRLKADAKAVAKGVAADYSKCELKFTDKFNSTETKAGGGVCPSEGDEASMNARITTDAAEIATLLMGGTVDTCGDGVIDAGEDCDFGDLDSETCTSRLAEEAIGALGCASDTCLFDTSGCQARYEEQNVGGEPTVVDHLTGLEWVVTNDTGSGLLDKDNTYSWSADSDNAADGTAFMTYIAGLNGGTYGGHDDWRLPSSGGAFGIGPFAPAELESIVDCSFGNPCIDEALFGDTASSFYWSATTAATDPDFAWDVGFNFSFVDGGFKTDEQHVRAVRGGL